MRVLPSSLLRGTGAAVAFALAGVSAAVPAAAVTPQTSAVSDMDDFHSNPAYAAIFTQKIGWDVKNCPSTQAPSTPSTPPQVEKLLKRLSPATAAVVRGAMQAPEPGTRGPMECATIDAPKNWNDLSQGTLKIGISRPLPVPHAPAPTRLLLSNPGGPGGTGIDFASEAEAIMKTKGTHLSIGIDPRGVGLSSNVTCPAANEVGGDVDPTLETFVTAKLTAQAEQLKKCHAEKDTLLPYIDTVSTARDFNLVRHLMGFQQADYFGVSYGTWLGAIMDKMFPSRFDRVVLDSNTDWRTASLVADFKHLPRGFQASLDRTVYPWLGRHHGTYGLGATGAEVQKTITELQLKALDMGFGGVLAAVFSNLGLVVSARQPQELLPMGAELQVVLKQFVNGELPTEPEPSDPSTPEPSEPPFSLPTPEQRPNVTTIAVTCNDSGSTGSLETTAISAIHLAKTYPLMGMQAAEMSCVDWPRPGTYTKEIANRPLSNVMMLQDENDGPTPYYGAFRTRVQEGTGVRMVMVDDGHGHVASRYACAANAGSEYLTKGAFPRSDVHCQAPALPAEKTVYEFGFAASSARPLSQVFLHRSNDIIEPAVDAAATASQPAQPRSSDAASQAARRLAQRDLHATFSQMMRQAMVRR